MAAFSKALSALLILMTIGLGAVRLRLVKDNMSPFSPLSLEDSDQWFVDFKLAALRDDPEACRTVLTPRMIDATSVPDRPPRANCGWSNAVAFGEIGGVRLSARPLTCDMAAATALWVLNTVLPAARATLGSGVAGIQTFGTYSCRDIEGSDRRSQHAKAAAIDISGFTLEDGRTISVMRDWNGSGPKAEFLKRVYDGACRYFRVTLGPDYNEAHADHFHFDRSGFWYCPGTMIRSPQFRRTRHFATVRIRTDSLVVHIGQEADYRRMAQPPQKHAFSPEELRTIDAAFNSAWTVLHVSGPYENWGNKDGLKLALRKRLFAFACHGITDREQLASITLRNFGL